MSANSGRFVVEKLSWLELIAYSVAAVGGALGGCAVASHGLLSNNKKDIRMAQFFAYMILGTMGALLSFSYSLFAYESIGDILGSSLLSGYSFAILLGAGNVTARAVLRRFGKEVQVTIRNIEDSDDDQG